MLVGGGSGGHLTPLIAVATAIKKQNPDTKIIDVGQRGEDLSEITNHSSIDEWYSIHAGKFRRYHGESFISHLLDIKTLLLNARDLFKFLVGTVQSYRLLAKLRPDSIMLKGGFVSVPVGIAARLRGVPYITHDSDAIPGLANRLTAKAAKYNTTAMPPDGYPYPPAKTVQVGIPLQNEFEFVSGEAKKQAKIGLGFSSESPVLFCVGGGLGAQKVNEAVAAAAPKLLYEVPTLTIIHLTGKKMFIETQQMYAKVLNKEQIVRVKLLDFSTELYRLSAAADLVITRAGATNIAEFAVQGKPCIVIPAPHLTGGQQLHNAKLLENRKAAIILQENEIDKLAETAIEILRSKEKSLLLGDTLHKVSMSGASEKLADILLRIADNTDI